MYKYIQYAGLETKGCPRARGTLNVLRARKNTGMRALLAPKKRPYYCCFYQKLIGLGLQIYTTETLELS